MWYRGSWSAFAGSTVFVLSSIAKYASAAAISGNSNAPFSNLTSPSTFSASESSSSSTFFSTGGGSSNTHFSNFTWSSTFSSSLITLLPVTSNTLPPATSSTLPPETSNTLSADTSRTLPPDTSSTLPPGTSNTLVSITSITLPPTTSTFVSSQAASAVSSVSSQIVALIPIINSWKLNPASLKTDTLDQVNTLKVDVEGLISDLGGIHSGLPCGSKKRGLPSLISDTVDTLSCIDDELNKITGVINTDDIEGIESTLDDLTSDNNDLTDNDDNKTNSNSNSDSSTGTSTGTSTNTETTSSCTATDIVSRVTVLCVPTIYSTGVSTLSTMTCSPTTTIITSGCAVTGTTTTISSSLSGPTQIACASDTCGDACPMRAAPLSGASMAVIATTEACSLISTVTTSVLPTASYGVLDSIVVASPTDSTAASSKRGFSSDLDYNKSSIDTFINAFTDTSASISKRALPDITPPYTSYVSALSEYITATNTWVSQDGLASGHWYPYHTIDQVAVGVNAIYGCMAVFIISEKGVYLSHIWEDPVFITGANWDPTDDASFTANTFNALRDGTADAQSITALIGTDDAPGGLNAIYAPKVFVLTPLATDDDRTYFGITTTLRYQDRAQTLANQIAGILPGSGGTGSVLGYTRTNKVLASEAAGVAGRAILEVDPFQQLLVTDSAGTVANHIGLQIGRWRLWVEDNLITYEDFWVPWTLPPAGDIQQRDLRNPCNGYTGNSTTSTSNSSVASSGAFSTSRSSSNTPTRTSISSIEIKSTQILSTSSPSSKTSGPSSITSAFVTITRSTGSISATSISSHSMTVTSSLPSSMPITSCTLSSVTAFSSGDIDYPATIACACNNGWEAGIGSTVGPDKATTYTCAVDTSTTIAVSTAPAPYHTGTCDLHIFEASLSYNEPLYVQLNITDGANDLLASQEFQLQWGDNASVPATESKLPYELNVDFLKQTTKPTRKEKRAVGPATPATTVDWEDWVLTLTAGTTKWDDTDTDSASLPYCSVGNWDNGNFWDWLNSVTSLGADQHSENRQMDCHWAC